MPAVAVSVEAPRPLIAGPPIEAQERQVRVAIDLEERTVEVRRGPELRCYVLAEEPELGGWIESGPAGQVSVGNVIDACLGSLEAERHIRRLSADGVRRAAERGRAALRRGARDEAADWQSVARGLGGELGKAGGPGRVPNLPLRVRYLELEQERGLSLSEVAFRMEWLTHRSKPGAPSADTSRVARRLGLEPSISNKGRCRPTWASSVTVETAAALCRGLGVDPHEVDDGWSVEVAVRGGATEPEAAPTPRRLRPRTSAGPITLEHHVDRAGRRRQLRLVFIGPRGALLLDQGDEGPDRLVAELDSEEGIAQARAAGREYLRDPRRGRAGLCRELTKEEGEAVAGIGGPSADTTHDNERAAA
jgi:hypothetical protein